MAERTVRRSKSKFKTARQAWSDIANDTGLTPKNVVRKEHTDKEWVWVVEGSGRAAAAIPATFQLGAQVKMESASEDSPKREFTMDAYTGAIFDIGFGPAVINLEGLALPREGVPIFRQHKPELFIGRSTGIRKMRGRLFVDGELFDNIDEADQVVRISDQGGRWQASVGVAIDFEHLQFVEPGKTLEANGQTHSGPFVLLGSTTLREVSFVPLGADSNTSAVALEAAAKTHQLALEAQETMDEKERIAALSAEFAKRPAFALKAINKGWTLEEAKERAAELDAALAEQATAHAAALETQKTAHEAALAEAKKGKPASPAAVLSGFGPGGAPTGDDGEPADAFNALVDAEEARLRERGHTGANKRGGGLRFSRLALGRTANLRARAVANVAEKHKDIHKAYLDAHNNVGTTRRGR